MNFLITFIILSVINVVFSTIRTITTIKSEKTIASLISGGYFAFYNIMLIYTVADFPLWQKCIITFVCNVIGVYIVKALEEKLRKDKLWKVELTVKNYRGKDIITALKDINIPYSQLLCANSDYIILNIYCATQKESKLVKMLADKYKAKYFVSETKNFY